MKIQYFQENKYENRKNYKWFKCIMIQKTDQGIKLA